jgi:hypothetical protein
MWRIVAVASLLGVLACAPPPPGGSAPAPTAVAPPVAAGPPLAVIVTRAHRVEVHAGGRYTVLSREGVVLARQVDAAALERDFPGLRGVLRRGVAGAKDQPVLLLADSPPSR